jgi:hypothetical protein
MRAGRENVLAYGIWHRNPGAHLVSAFTGWRSQPIGSIWKLVSDYSSATASELHGVPFLDLLSIVDSQRTDLAIGPAFAGGKRFVRRPKAFGSRLVL